MLQNAGTALSHGKNIYTITGITGATFRPLEGFAYLPGAAVLVWAFHALFGDVRYGLLAAMTVTALTLARVRNSASIVVLGAFVLLYPKALFGLAQSWVDPLILAAVCLTAFAVERGRMGWAVVAFAICLTCKQQAWLMLPLAACWRQFGWRRATRSAALAVALMIPWIVTAPQAFYRGAIEYNLSLAPRYNSLSLITTALWHGIHPGLAVLIVATVGTMVVAGLRSCHDTYGFLVSSAAVVAVFNLTNKQSFFNEWELVAGLALLAMVFSSTDEARAPCLDT